jgi:hypothetical protein
MNLGNIRYEIDKEYRKQLAIYPFVKEAGKKVEAYRKILELIDEIICETR